jgi:DNA (cytosine-5)-methyltransferase 1
VPQQFRVFDAFAGCGGLSLGLQAAGHEVTAANELDVWAADTYEANHPHVRMLRGDVRALDSSFLRREFNGVVDLVAGGPPCQGFSVSGSRQYGVHSEKNQLVREYVRIVRAIEPTFFVLENVRGFTSARLDGRTQALAFVLNELTNAGYELHHAVLQAADYGVPQYRSRLFVIGAREPLKASPFPDPTHSADGSLLRHLGVMEAIGDLHELGAGEGSDGPVPYRHRPTTAFQIAMRAGSDSLLNHQAMKHTRRLVERFAATPPGGKGYDIGRGSVSTVQTVTVYKSNNQRLIGDHPSLCITANFQSTYVHPEQHRNLTAREAARLQTFPDKYEFRGRRTLMSSTLLRQEGRDDENHLSQYNQIGNAVPPALARLVGERLALVAAGEVAARPRPVQPQLDLDYSEMSA